jgi:hypothetical protein
MTTFQERFDEARDRVDPEEFVGALQYVRGEQSERPSTDRR